MLVREPEVAGAVAPLAALVVREDELEVREDRRGSTMA